MHDGNGSIASLVGLDFSSSARLHIMAESGWVQWTIILVLTALVLSLVVVAQNLSTFSAAYMAAPREVATFIDTVDFSIQENESYDRDVAKVQRLEDKIRLGRLLREIQKEGDDLREELNGLMLGESATSLRTGARLLWASKRTQLEDRVRRLDLLRMRFLIVYMGIITSNQGKQTPQTQQQQQQQQQQQTSPIPSNLPPIPAPPPLPRDPEKTAARRAPGKPVLHKAHTDLGMKRSIPRRLTTQAIGHNESVGRPQRRGWAGVVEELQMSPLMHKRHASIENAMENAMENAI